MKKLRYIYALITVVLLSTVIYSCDDSSMFITEEVDTAESSSNGETVKTTFTIGISAPNVSGDLDVATRAGVDNANIEYAKPENGGRFQNLIVVLTDHNDKIYGVECREYNDGVGRKDEEVTFSNIEVPTADVNNQDYKVYAFGNVCTQHYNAFKGDTASANESIKGDLSNRKTISDLSIYANCITSNISVSDPYQINFEQEKTYNVGDSPVSSTGMPVNNMVSATVKKGNTQFNVALKRVCARLQVTFRNFTGKTGYSGEPETGNNVYVDKFEIKNVLANKANYFCNNTTSVTGVTSSNFDILQALGGSKTNDHIINKIENGKDLVVSMYVFENNKGGYQYDLKVDRGKSLGNRAESLQDGNVYVMWSDNLDPGSYSNNENRCLGADDKKILLFSMNDPSKIPYGTGDYGNRVFWHYNEKKFQSCKVDLKTDICELTNKYIGGKTARPLNQPEYEMNLQSSGHAFDISHKDFEGYRRTALKVSGNSYMMISNNKLKARYITNVASSSKPCYPWVFFAKYIIKNGETFSTGTGTSKTAISQIDRNHSYELDFSVMPNYDTKQELLVSCVRKQNEINWSEVEK